jgi:hypothetical protein
MTELEKAANRLRTHYELQCNSIGGNDKCPYNKGHDISDDRQLLACAYLAETDPTPVDEDYVNSTHIPASCPLRIKTFENGFPEFWLMGQLLKYRPTIGDVRTAARLFRITLKEPT